MSDSERHDWTLRLSERVYRALLVAYPAEFRQEYVAHMRQAFRDLCREELGHRGVNGLVRLWARTLSDLAATALTERSKTMRRKLLMYLSLIVGLLIALVDASPGWDDTGISALAVASSCGFLGTVHPARDWQWALAVGLWIPALGIALHQNYESWAALVVAFVGAYAGALVGRLVREEPLETRPPTATSTSPGNRS